MAVSAATESSWTWAWIAQWSDEGWMKSASKCRMASWMANGTTCKAPGLKGVGETGSKPCGTNSGACGLRQSVCVAASEKERETGGAGEGGRRGVARSERSMSMPAGCTSFA